MGLPQLAPALPQVLLRQRLSPIVRRQEQGLLGQDFVSFLSWPSLPTYGEDTVSPH